MSEFLCNAVYSGWEDIANPDDVDVIIKLERTIHEFYPSLRELVLLYDTVAEKRDTEFVIGTADYIVLKNESSDSIEVDLAPLCFKTKQSVFLASLEELLQSVFREKNKMSSQSEREQALDNIDSWLEEQEATTDVHAMYAELTESQNDG